MSLQILLLLLVQLICGVLKVECPMDLKREEILQMNFYRSGDHLISGISSFSVTLSVKYRFNMAPPAKFYLSSPKVYWKVLSFLFALEEINQNPQILPNITLGYNIHDSYSTAKVTSEALLDLLSKGEADIPNYSCGKERNTLVVLEEADTDISIYISGLLNLYKIPQVSYTFPSKVLRDRKRFPFFYSTFPTETNEYLGIIKILQYFKWTLVGLIGTDSENGDKFMSLFTFLLDQNDICVVFSVSVSSYVTYKKKDVGVFDKWNQVKILLYYAEVSTFLHGLSSTHFLLTNLGTSVVGKLWITTAFWDLTLQLSSHVVFTWHNYHIFSLLSHTNKKLNYDHLSQLQSFAKRFMNTLFSCSYSKHALSMKGWTRCTERGKLSDVPQELRERILSQNGYHIYHTTWTVAHALHAAYSLNFQRRGTKIRKDSGVSRVQPWQLHPFLYISQYYNNSMEGVYLDQKGDLAVDFDIMSWETFPNWTCNKVKVGSLERKGLSEDKFKLTVDQTAIRMPLPRSQCVDSCLPGFVKLLDPMKPICCYHCVPCAEGTISTQEGG